MSSKYLTSGNILRTLAATGLIVASSFLGTPRTSYADDVPTTANLVAGSGATMTIECQWELPDMTPNDLTVTYGPAAGPNDDTPSVLASGTPCTAPVAPAFPPTMQNYRTNMMGMRPNPHDQPILRQYEKWVSVYSSSVSSIIDVYFKVWEPYVTGPGTPNCATPISFAGDPNNSALYCFKYQHHATPTRGAPSASNPLTSVNCADLFTANGLSMFNAAVQTGQMHSSDVGYTQDKCVQGEKRVFKVQEDVSKEQSCGEYRVETTVVNSAATATNLVSFFDVLCFNHLAADFSSVDFGTIQNGQDNVVSGDNNFNTAENPSAPTVQNQGNQPAYVQVVYDPMLLQSDTTKQITTFDLKARASWQTISQISTIPTIEAGQVACFIDQPIAYNQTSKIDFSVHPFAAQVGTYIGQVHVLLVPSCPAGSLPGTLGP